MRANIDLEGAVDIHGHCGPSLFDRRVDGYEYAREAADAGMDAIVMKEHFLPTVTAVPFIDRLLARDGRSIDVFGSLVMNYCNGGFNPFAVQTAIEYGARAIWCPTLDARRQAEQTGGVGQHTHHIDSAEKRPPEYRSVDGLSALEDGALVSDLRLCLDTIVEHDVMLGVGHLSYPETEAVVEYLQDAGHEKTVVDHPNYSVPDFSLAQQRALVASGALINIPFTSISPAYGWIESETVGDQIRELGVENCVLSSGAGQVPNPSVPEALRLFGEILYEHGFSASDVDVLLKSNPRRLID